MMRKLRTGVRYAFEYLLCSHIPDLIVTEKAETIDIKPKVPPKKSEWSVCEKWNVAVLALWFVNSSCL
jgi:hypothetical protein